MLPASTRPYFLFILTALFLVTSCTAPGLREVEDGASLYALCEICLKQSDYLQAESLGKKILALREAHAAKSNNKLPVAASLDALARVYSLHFAHRYQIGEWNDDARRRAEPLFKRALAIREKELGSNNLAVAETLHHLAFLYHVDDSQDDLAEVLYKRARAIYESNLALDDLGLAATLDGLGQIYLHQASRTGSASKYASGEALCKRALEIKEARLGASAPALAESLNSLGKGYMDQNRLDEAETLFRRALSLEERPVNVENDALESENNLYALYEARDNLMLASTFTVGDYQYVPIKKEGKQIGLKILKGGHTILANDLVCDYHHSPGNIVESVDNSYNYAQKSLVFPLAHARIKKSFDCKGEHNLSLEGDVYTRLPAINKLVSKSNTGLIISTFSGGANSCCTDYELFSLGEQATKLPSLEGRNVYSFTFGDFDGDGRLQALGADMTFVYWNGSRPECPTPSVVLTYNGGEWHLSAKDMFINHISEDKIHTAVTHCRKVQADVEKVYTPAAGQFSLRPTVWAIMLNLIYAGHADDARKFLDDYWPQGKVSDQTDEDGNSMDKQAFLTSFKNVLKNSPYYDDLLKLNHGHLF